VRANLSGFARRALGRERIARVHAAQPADAVLHCVGDSGYWSAWVVQRGKVLAETRNRGSAEAAVLAVLGSGVER
jgi:hypothetical protein